MTKMKDSGIEWIGEIPEDWNVTKIKYSANIFGRIGFRGYTQQDLVDFEEEGAITLSPSNIQDSKMNYGKCSYLTWAKYYESPEIQVHNGDIMFVKTGSSYGKSAIIESLPKEATINPQLVLFKNILPDLHYFFYNLQTESIKTQCELSVVGGTIPTMSQEKMYNFYFPLPPLETQKRIADFLDAKCAKIDSLKNDIQKQIETLEQYKKSVITEAVTKGINPNAKMKDSGVEWIGNIPEHWEVSNPKWHFTQRKDRAKLGLKQYTASQKYGVISQEEYMERTGAKIVTVAKDFDILKLVCPGDFVIHMRSFQGGLEYSEAYGSISSAYVMLIPQKTIANPRYYRWFFKSPVYIDALSSTSNLIRDGQAMRYANFVQIPILIPTADEQTDIANYLDKKCSSIDSIITTKKQQLEKLEEYKKSLIFEYVTGKREVSCEFPSETSGKKEV